MRPGLLLDTNVVLRWLITPKRLTRDQKRELDAAVRREQPVAISAITLVEIAVLEADGRISLGVSLGDFFEKLESNPVFEILPISFEVAAEVANLSILRDPADRTIVATARVHRLKLVTFDQRIIESGLVPVID